MDGLDEEIAILRVKLREIIERDPENVELALKAASTIARLVRTRYNVSQEQRNSLEEAITNVTNELAIPLGVKALIR